VKQKTKKVLSLATETLKELASEVAMKPARDNSASLPPRTCCP
jgi:hypothetical protein